MGQLLQGEPPAALKTTHRTGCFSWCFSSQLSAGESLPFSFSLPLLFYFCFSPKPENFHCYSQCTASATDPDRKSSCMWTCCNSLYAMLSFPTTSENHQVISIWRKWSGFQSHETTIFTWTLGSNGASNLDASSWWRKLLLLWKRQSGLPFPLYSRQAGQGKRQSWEINNSTLMYEWTCTKPSKSKHRTTKQNNLFSVFDTQNHVHFISNTATYTTEKEKVHRHLFPTLPSAPFLKQPLLRTLISTRLTDTDQSSSFFDRNLIAIAIKIKSKIQIKKIMVTYRNGTCFVNMYKPSFEKKVCQSFDPLLQKDWKMKED